MVFGYGHEAGEALVLHPDVPLVSFTGSTAIGARIMEKTAPMVKKVSLELGGKNPALVFEASDSREYLFDTYFEGCGYFCSSSWLRHEQLYQSG